MIDLLEQFGLLLGWLADPRNLPESLIFLVAEFCLMHWLYYKFRENVILRVIFGTIYAPQNFVFNVFVLSIIGLELPRETACTKRMQRWKKEGGDSALERWRVTFSETICGILNKFDPGHC